MVARRGTFRRGDQQAPDVERKLTLKDSASSRSSSPPNSVDAFAAPARRRPRAGTMDSQAISMTNQSVSRHGSTISHSRRRPTFSDARRPDLRDDDVARSVRTSIEADVCFPPLEENNKTYTIDFEELEEFVAESHHKTPVAHPFTAPNGHPQQATKTFKDLRVNKQCDCGKPDKKEDMLDEKASLDVDRTSSQQGDRFVDGKQQSTHTNVNRWTFFSSEIDETIHAPELEGLLMPGETFRDIFELGPDGGVWWLDMLNPSEEEVFAICKAFGVHPLTREDITTQETHEKVELFHAYYFVCFRSFYQETKERSGALEAINVYAVVFREGLLTFSFCPNPHAANVRKRIGRLRDYVNLSADWICYAMIDEIVDGFAPALRELELETDAIEDSVFTAHNEDYAIILRRIGDCRKQVMSLIRLLGGKADVIKGFAKRCNEQYAVTPRGDVGLYLSDVQDHVVTMMSNLSHFEKILSRSHSNYLAQISIDNINQGNDANKLLGKVTLIATILVPLNLIAGVFGMNTHNPAADADGFGWFFGIIGVMAALVLIACVVFRWRRLI